MYKVIYDDRQSGHDPLYLVTNGKFVKSREHPDRAANMLKACSEAGFEIRKAKQFDRKHIHAVHSERYVKFLETAFDEWAKIPGSGAEVIPNVFPVADEAICPTSTVGRAGFHISDLAAPIGAGTWQAALGAAEAALTAAECILEGDKTAYALCRPPGHHAFSERASGYCFLNNAAIAANYLTNDNSKVALLDVDVHHGNGSQDIFYSRDDVFFASIHADPNTTYPFFWGYPEQNGKGKGEGYTANVPLPIGTNDEQFILGLNSLLQKIDDFKPDRLVISLGLDTFGGDPYKLFNLTTGCYRRMSKEIAKLGIATVIIQEGGYLCDQLGDNLTEFLTGIIDQ
ncbi:MAG: histone deacetylase family protein [Kordiimonadaceae bacterium]|jgi:acetoin utilization deacetylase AcuC-like enzyme|nr:histone deacetylase family protein [Kordiimonadaceae bacterium]MBT6031452.1 histone deacetylase family protein [Kordiimonadaceae bacterium]